MSQSIDTKIVELKFNNDNFAEKVDSTLTKLQNLNKAIDEDGLSNALKNFGKSAKNVDMKPITDGVQEATKGFSKMEIAGITALANISNAAVNLGKRLMSKLISPLTQGVMQGGLARARNIEQATFQFEGLKIDKSDPTLSYYKEVMDAVLGTSYSYDVAAKAASQLAASNIGVEETTRKLADGTTITSKVMTGDMTKALLGMAGVASMTGSDFDSISQIFTRVAGQGKVMAMDLNSIASRGLNAAAVLADSLHKTEAEVREMVSKGKISFDDFSKAMSDAYGAHAKDSTLMFQGALDDVNAALARIGADFYGPALKAGRDILNSITPVVDAVHNKLAPVLSKSGSFMDSASKSLSQYLDMLSYLIERFPKGKEAMSDWISEHMNAWTNIADLYGRGDFKKAVDGLSDFMAQVDGMEGQGIDGWQMIADYLNVTKEEAIALGDKGAVGFNTFYKAFRQLWSQSDKLTNIVGITTVFDDYVRSVIRAQEPTEKFNRHVEVFFSIIKGGQSLFQSAKTMLGGLVDIFATLAKHLAPLGKLFLDFAASSAQFVVNVADFMATSESFNSIVDGIVSLIQKLFSLIDLAKIASLALGALGKAFDFIVKAIERIDSGFAKIVNAIHNLLSKMIDKIKEIVSNTELLRSIFEDLKHAGMIVAIINLIGALTRPMDMLKSFGKAVENVGDSFSKLVGQVGKVFDSIAGMAGKIGKVIDEVTMTLKRMQELLIATAILEIAAAIAVLAGALYLLSKIKGEQISDVLVPLMNFGAIAGTLFAATKVMSSVTSKTKIWEKSVDSIKGVALALLEFSAAMAILAGAVYLLSKIDKKQLVYATGAIEVLMFSLMAVAKVLSVTTTKDTGLKALWSGKKTSTSMTKGLMGLIAMAEAVNILSKALTNVASIGDPYQMAAALGVIEMLLWSLMGVTALLSGDKAQKMTKGTTALLAMALAVRMLTQPVMEFASIDPVSMTQGALGVGALMLSLGILMKVISGTKGAITSAAAVLILAQAIKQLEIVVLAFSDMDGESLAKGIGSIVGMLLGLGLALNFIDGEGVIAKAAGLVLIAMTIKNLQDVINNFASDPEAALNGIAVLAAALGTLFGAVEVFSKAPIAGILKLFATLALGAIVVAAFGVAIGVFGVGIGVFGAGLASLSDGVAAASSVSGPLIAMMVAFAIAVGLLSSVGLPAIGVILALSLAFLMLGGGMALMGNGLDTLAGAMEVMTSLKDKLGETAIKIGEFIAQLGKLSGEASKIGDSFKTISDPFEKINEVAKSVTENIQTLSKEYTDLLAQTANSMQTLSTALTTLTTLNETSMGKATELITGFVEALKGISEDTTAISNTGQAIANSMDVIKLAIQGVIDTMTNFEQKSIQQFTAMGEGLSHIAEPIKILDSMRLKLVSLAENLIEFVTSLSTMKDQAAVVSEGATSIANALTQVGDAATLAKDSLGGFTTATATILTNIGSGLESIAKGAKGMVAVKDSLDSAASSFSNFFSTLSSLSGTAAAIAQGTNTIAAAVASLGSAAVKAAQASSKGMADSGKEMVTHMASGLTKNKKTLSTAVSNVIESSASAGKNKYQTFYSIGSNLVAGMVAGLRSQQAALEREVAALEAKAERALKAEAKINSPSKVWMTFGSYMGEGLAIGIRNSANKVSGASKGLAAVSEDALSSAIASINRVIEDDWDTSPVITPIVDLNDVRNGASYINSLLNANTYGIGTSYGNGLANSISKEFQNGRKSPLESSLKSLTDQMGSMTDTMNSRSLTINNTIDGASDPEAFADGLIRSFRLKARTI